LLSGPGTVALELASQCNFQHVLAVDRSNAQLQNAPKHAAVQYVQGDLPAGIATALPDSMFGTVQLMTVGQGLHWFDTQQFVHSIAPYLHPSTGVFAVMGYGLSRVSNSHSVVQAAYNQFCRTIEPFWDPQCKRHLLENAFETESFAPLQVIERVRLDDSRMLTCAQLVGYLRSWSSYNTFKQQRAASEPDALDLVEQAVLHEIGADGKFEFTVPFFLTVAKSL
jgi:hypothetical protein